MTTVPAYPLRHAYLGDADPEETIDTRIGRMERWRADALLLGEVSGLSALRDHVKNDAVAAIDEVEQREQAVAARERIADAREQALRATAARLDALAERITEEWDRIEQVRADQERERNEPLAEPPDPTSKVPEPSLSVGDDRHAYATDLPDLPQQDPEDPEQPDSHGEFLRRTGDQGDPEQFVNPELPHPPAQQQPTSAGLDME